MTYRVPYLTVIGPDGTDLVPVWGRRLIGVKIVSRIVGDVDTCDFTFANEPPYLAAPAENTPFRVGVGWEPVPDENLSIYYLHGIHLRGEPKTEGDIVTFECVSGLMAGLDNAGSQHFNAENGNHTLGDVFNNLFAGAGMAVEVAASIAGLPLPGGHLLQWKQSAIDFASDVADNVGAVVKPMGGKILVLDRNSGQSVSGRALAIFNVDKYSTYLYDVQIEPRFQYQSVTASYFDNDAGRLMSETSTGGSEGGAKQGLPHPSPDQASAQSQAKAVADEYKRFTGTGLFVIPGEPLAASGAKPIFTRFPDPIGTTDWLVAEVTHDVTPEDGWITTIETETDPG